MTNPGHPAFLQKPELFYVNGERGCDISFGLTKREYFAAMAMQGVIHEKHHFYLYADGETQELNSPETYSKLAVAIADALIAELNK